jgi:hypothetical protein
MGWLVLFSIGSAWIPAKALAQKWERGVLVPVAAIIGMVCSLVVTMTVAVGLSYSNPDVFPQSEAFLDALGSSGLSFVISPIAAIVGWRRAKNPPSPSSPSAPTPGAFDNLKRK